MGRKKKWKKERKERKKEKKRKLKSNGEPVTMLTSRSIVQQMGEDGKEKQLLKVMTLRCIGMKHKDQTKPIC